MDIVSRLKSFMDSQQIASSQFADKCGIPRPTVSQILNGRNKKISDELIGKIHSAFPDLSVLWLMFGEGEMLIKSNIEISEPQNRSTLSFLDINLPEDKNINPSADPFSSFNQNQSEKSTAVFTDDFGQAQQPNTPISLGDNSESQSSDAIGKRISSIVVFYEDNTFQTFHPATFLDS